MTDNLIKLEITFEALADALSKLSLEDKNRLLEILEEQIAYEEEERFEQDPVIHAEMEQARAEARAKDTVSFEDYLAHQEQEDS